MVRSVIHSVFYVAAGPLFYVADLLVLRVAASATCAGPLTGVDFVSIIVILSAVTIGGCAAILWRALTNQRTVTSLTRQDRRVDFFAGGLAVASLVAIGLTALPAMLSKPC